ncbi:RodZ domain-containing protein [Pseudidiomarina insulisalsae]|uniref:HTH cro/C1-type domain-containing protein n=1 Tax=Pseudidiomarina insulisalsae TaxID=575789 RepID=A0A432YNV3_9GAMM|nr:RodZ domain-containing protein [Pseudidiomarina insulisalsae]RUO62572.1 hypothetical protein CWI71_03825 [Pseudidiomarina insulisalsae]
MTSDKDLFNDEAPEQGAAQPTRTPGKLLTEARENKGLTQQQVADSLRLRLAVVQFIEADEYEKLSSPTFVRGYLRSMAKALEVSEEEIFAAYREHGYDVSQASNVKMQSFSRRKVRERNDSRLKWISYIIIISVLALVLIWWWQESGFSLTTITGSEDAPTEQEAQQQREASQNIPQVVRPEPQVTQRLTEAEARAAQISTEMTPAEAEPGIEPESLDVPEENIPGEIPADITPAEDPTEDPAQDPAENPTENPASGTGTTTPAAEAAEALVITANEANAPSTVTAAAEEQLVFAFNQACWVKVTDATGEEIAIGVKAEGYRMPLTGEPPFDIILCRPEAVTITYNGENVNLDSYVRDRSVTLTLD